MERTTRVNFYATLRPIVGAKTAEFAVREGTTERQLIGVVVERHPGIKPMLLDESGELFRHVHVFINGRDAPYLEQALDTVVGTQDTVDIFPAVAGG